MTPDKESVGLRPLTKKRLERMKAEAIILGWSLKSIDEAVDLLIQTWDRARQKGTLENLVRPPAHLR